MLLSKTVTNPGGRLIIIGDLHGCFDEAMEMLDLCQVTANDKVVFCGDLIDRGPENAKCVELAMKHECVLGNHEERHIQYYALEEKGKKLGPIPPNHSATREQLNKTHYEYFKTLPSYIKVPEHNTIIVHAGVYPGIPMESQKLSHLLHIQMINPPNFISKWPSKAPEGWKFWSTLWTGPERIVFGHSVFDRPLVTNQVVGIDGGAVFGRNLWAYELPSGKVYEVKSKFDCNGSRSRTTKLIPVHGEVCVFS